MEFEKSIEFSNEQVLCTFGKDDKTQLLAGRHEEFYSLRKKKKEKL